MGKLVAPAEGTGGTGKKKPGRLSCCCLVAIVTEYMYMFTADLQG